jgi:hypothetical protein
MLLKLYELKESLKAQQIEEGEDENFTILFDED